MASEWHPYREPLRVTMLRTGVIAIVVGGVIARFSGKVSWPTATLLVLWPSFGGHWVEIWFLNLLRPRLPLTSGLHAGTRLGVWFAGGTCLAIGMGLTAMALPGYHPVHWPAWWLEGLAFIGIELVIHLVLQLRGRPSFYNCRG